MDHAAPLVSIPEAPTPEGGSARFLTGRDGARFRLAWFPVDGARGTVVLSPGRTEPIEKYFEAVDDFRRRGFAVLAHDWRGQGLCDRPLPDRLKGHATGWDDYLFDYGAVLDAFEGVAPQPWIAVAHSLGGCLALLALVEGERRLAGAALSAPMVRIQTGGRPYVLSRILAWIMARGGQAAEYVLGDANNPFEHTFERNALTRDRVRYERWRAQLAACPDLGLGGVTWGWLDFAFRATSRLLDHPGLETVDRSIVIVGAEEDAVVDNRALKTAAERLQRARYVEVAGALHEVMMETDDKRRQFFAAFDELAAELQD